MDNKGEKQACVVGSCKLTVRASQFQVEKCWLLHCESAMPVFMLQTHSCGYALCLHAHARTHTILCVHLNTLECEN